MKLLGMHLRRAEVVLADEHAGGKHLEHHHDQAVLRFEHLVPHKAVLPPQLLQ